MTLAAIYARVSSTEQCRRGTIESQRRTLLARAAASGYEVVGVYEDDGLTARAGHLEARDGLRRLLIDATAGRFAVLLVVDVDRLTRADDLIERASILGPLQRAGVTIITSGGVLDMSTMAGDVMVGLHTAMAADERRKLLERTARGRMSAILRGSKPSGPAPYGLRWSKAAGWSVDEAEAAVVVEIHERIAAGETCHDIAVSLAARHIPGPRSPWTQWNVWHVARYARTRYAGQWLANKARGLAVPVPRVLDDDLIDRVEAALVNAKRRGLTYRTTAIYLLDRGAATCARCGATIGVQTGKVASHTVATYVCTGRTRRRVGDPRRCDLPIYRVRDVDGALWAELVEWVAQPELVARKLAERAGRAEDATPALWLARSRAELERVRGLEAVAIDQAIAGRLTATELAARLAPLGRARAAAEEAVQEAQRAHRDVKPGNASAEDVEAAVEALRLRMASAEPEERRRVARSLLTEATVTERGLAVGVGLPVPGAAWRGRNRTADVTVRIYVPRRDAA